MSQRSLESLLRPKSIAVIGASNQPGRNGHLVMLNLLNGGFPGPIMPVTPRYQAVCGVLAYPTIADLPCVPDLAILCTNAQRTPALIAELGTKGCRAAIVIASPASQADALRSLALRYGVRLLGPNSLGLLAPWQKLNASFSPVPILPGRLAFISQSAAVSNTILDWARQREIGFSLFVALGDSLDTDVDELLDYLARDAKTSAILLYLEHLHDARRFLSAARSAARNKPILVIKSGRTPQARRVLGEAAGLDIAYDAAIQRAGLLRVQNTHELFSAVETLSHMHPLRGERLLIVGNGAAPIAMALDELQRRGGHPAPCDDALHSALCAALPAETYLQGPIDLRDDATPARYQAALQRLLDSRCYDALLIQHAPSATAPATETARALIETLSAHPRARHVTLMTNWSGENTSQEARRLFSEAGIPTYRTPEGAVTAFMHMVEYRRNQRQLMETPALPASLPANAALAHRLLAQAQADGVTRLDTHEVRDILACYGLDTLPGWIANDSTEAVHIAERIGYPVALKLRSPDIAHNSDVQGVMLYLRNAREVEQAANAIFDRARQAYPQARILGLLVQGTANRIGAQELRICVENDAVFGPLILLGEGGAEWDAQRDAAAALPPLNMNLARYLIVQAQKRGHIRRRAPLADLDIAGLSQVLVQVSHLIVDCPTIQRLEIHPLLACGSTFTLLDVSLQLLDRHAAPTRLAICPYPYRLKESIRLKNGGDALLRPILPEDEPLLQQFIQRVSKEDLYYRYFSEINEFTHEDLAKMTQIDYEREMAFVAVQSTPQGEEILGVTRALIDPDNTDAEFAVLVRSDRHGLGLGSILLDKLIRYARQRQLRRLQGITMPTNRGMIALARKIGFQVEILLEDGIVNLSLSLSDSTLPDSEKC
ncbi:bifunctional acetate--CoA ligase family protein/GNAT family N-acetyltransferase [Edwardsiella anguillarum]|uniref:bifunctional acetate--CoA ligase family protein/GNAT family N-acetyltransferase n=1 Tax=Edwardsiella anguillarum TaxID=1821960 RepID=UPI0024B6A20D|nr:bifunctional acetate--CoA ligase family protein/GNAT family N-acetyltransferase [Edwardsiella anguillarum]WHP80819.1 bifunctional acetate--CoA ligase family protein/GNAT family N-acetyltransferase [Edwardsiella anguillarum]WHQ18321.1 bifunctional acetate--CoA ligase family protein/GNAT family N-acetyltransferase [Edwardsiella anguillarum]WHQ21859.1 bifunctional acetate--CoA ligase family protein/GNAT family N-acetyltransferase [Edwardsiella anguillarum]WHQ25383.1 bifunctional acetate--CoA li